MNNNPKGLALFSPAFFSLLFLAVALSGCSAGSGSADCVVQQWGAYAENTAAGLVNQIAGVPLLPTTAAPVCSDTSPPPGPLSAGYGGGGACGAADGDDHCVACMKQACCSQIVACDDDTSGCVCNIACNSVGDACTSSIRAKACGAEDNLYDATVACARENCAEECPHQ